MYIKAKLEIGVLVFGEGGGGGGGGRGGNWRTRRKTLGARTGTNNKLNPHVTPGPGIEPGKIGHIFTIAKTKKEQ